MKLIINTIQVMLGEEEGREAAVRLQLAKIARANPNAIPLYIIVNSGKREETVEQPITLCSKDSTLKDLLVRLHKKYPQFQNIYFFGKEKSAGKIQGKKKSKVSVDEEEKIIAVQQSMLERRVQQIHQIYKDSHGLLVIIVSERALIAKPKQTIEPILLVLSVLFALVFLYLSFTEESSPSGERGSSEFDYIV